MAGLEVGITWAVGLIVASWPGLAMGEATGEVVGPAVAVTTGLLAGVTVPAGVIVTGLWLPPGPGLGLPGAGERVAVEVVAVVGVVLPPVAGLAVIPGDTGARAMPDVGVAVGFEVGVGDPI